jgi:hypothetical protein
MKYGDSPGLSLMEKLMTSRRGFLQTLGAVFGSTVLPAGAVASVASAAPVAEVAAGVMAAVAVARQFKTTVVLDAQTYEPKIAVAITADDKSHYLGDSTPLSEVKIDGKGPMEFIDHSTPERRIESQNLLNMVVIREQLERQGLPPLTNEEAAMIMAQNKETA